MAEFESPYCPECDDAFDFPEPSAVDRRNFIRVLGGAAAAVTLGAGRLAAAPVAAPAEKKANPAEELVRELYSGLSETQKKRVVLDYDHKQGKDSRPTRKGMYNAPIANIRLRDVYTKPQQELVERIVKALSNGDDGFRRISRGGTWDGSKTFDGCGALIFGDPTPGNKFAFVFAGHHLTIRCDGDTEEGPAFGGPIYYGHSPNGYSRGNIFNYQTRSVIKVYDALSAKQREQALIGGATGHKGPGEMINSVQFRARPEDRPGLPASELTRDQIALVEQVMRDVLSPYRKEDVDEVMNIIKKNGGLEKIKLAFFEDMAMKDNEPWHFWRLEGPGFVWNYRVLPHVHTYVNISSKLA